MIHLKFSDGTVIDLDSSVEASADVIDSLIPPFQCFESVDRVMHARSRDTAIRMKLTPEGERAYRELLFFGKHLKPAPPHIEKILTQREAWDAVYHTCRAKIRELLDEYVAGDITEATAHEGLTFLCRVCTRACDLIEHYDLCYSLEFTIDEDFD